MRRRPRLAPLPAQCDQTGAGVGAGLAAGLLAGFLALVLLATFLAGSGGAGGFQPSISLICSSGVSLRHMARAV